MSSGYCVPEAINIYTPIPNICNTSKPNIHTQYPYPMPIANAHIQYQYPIPITLHQYQYPYTIAIIPYLPINLLRWKSPYTKCPNYSINTSIIKAILSSLSRRTLACQIFIHPYIHPFIHTSLSIHTYIKFIHNIMRDLSDES